MNDPADQPIDLRRAVEALRRSRWLILAIVATVTGVVAIVSLTSAKRYTATATLAYEARVSPEGADPDAIDRLLGVSERLVTASGVLDAAGERAPGGAAAVRAGRARRPRGPRLQPARAQGDDRERRELGRRGQRRRRDVPRPARRRRAHPRRRGAATAHRRAQPPARCRLAGRRGRRDPRPALQPGPLRGDRGIGPAAGRAGRRPGLAVGAQAPARHLARPARLPLRRRPGRAGARPAAAARRRPAGARRRDRPAAARRPAGRVAAPRPRAPRWSASNRCRASRGCATPTTSAARSTRRWCARPRRRCPPRSSRRLPPERQRAALVLGTGRDVGADHVAAVVARSLALQGHPTALVRADTSAARRASRPTGSPRRGPPTPSPASRRGPSCSGAIPTRTSSASSTTSTPNASST